MAKGNTYIQLTKEAITVHEISSVLIPGVFTLFCINLMFPMLGNFIVGNLSIGALIVFLLLSYGTGHFVQAVGSIIEKYIIRRIWGNVKILNPTKKVDSNMIVIYRNHKILCRGIATSLLILLVLAWINGKINISDLNGLIYSILIFLASICIFVYMRRFERREYGIIASRKKQNK
jgi:hypothetical protein